MALELGFKLMCFSWFRLSVSARTCGANLDLQSAEILSPERFKPKPGHDSLPASLKSKRGSWFRV